MRDMHDRVRGERRDYTPAMQFEALLPHPVHYKLVEKQQQLSVVQETNHARGSEATEEPEEGKCSS
jgi:hypothetical protein